MWSPVTWLVSVRSSRRARTRTDLPSSSPFPVRRLDLLREHLCSGLQHCTFHQRSKPHTNRSRRGERRQDDELTLSVFSLPSLLPLQFGPLIISGIGFTSRITILLNIRESTAPLCHRSRSLLPLSLASTSRGPSRFRSPSRTSGADHPSHSPEIDSHQRLELFRSSSSSSPRGSPSSTDSSPRSSPPSFFLALLGLLCSMLFLDKETTDLFFLVTSEHSLGSRKDQQNRR